MIQTKRLMLVPYQISYLEATLLGDEKLTEVSGFQVAKQWPGVEFFFYLPFVLDELKLNPAMEKWTYLVILKENNTIIGEVSAQGNPDKTGSAEIGYGIVDDYGGCGYGMEAASAFIHWLENYPIPTIVAKTYQNNKKSQHILQKLGFVKAREELLGGDEIVYHFEYDSQLNR
ncbi:GNAT family N-acetyltransferase [Carnobacterium gallinarum]|uniref:GNAT family N-acetyltransferase n=1 Tax=Carnobacterium gallinarum TaxID=2749 RepID=UPI00054EF1AB|nr:GNAT family N-acetyltransferase [Carnobacterium gallinarum]